MLLPTFLSTFALALTANAFLVPLEVADNALAGDVVTTNSLGLKYALACESCPVALGSKNSQPESWAHGIKNSLQLDFNINGKQLSLNGLPFFPLSREAMMRNVLSAKQSLNSGSNMVDGQDLFDRNLPLSTSVDIQSTEAMSSSEGNFKIHKLALEVIGIMGKVVRVPTVHVNVIELANGQVRISFSCHLLLH